jgi:hypothetical protein
MKTKMAMAGVAALLLALVLAPAAGAAPTVSARADESVPVLPSAAWMMKAVGGKYGNGRIKELTYRGFAKLRKASEATWIDPDSGDVYYGVTLKRLVGLVDDTKPGSFNKAKAAANKYSVAVKSVDGFTYTWSSADVATLDIIVATHYSPGGAAYRVVLPLGELRDTPRWIPAWPAKLVGDEPSTSGKKRIGGVNRIMLGASLTPD